MPGNITRKGADCNCRHDRQWRFCALSAKTPAMPRSKQQIIQQMSDAGVVAVIRAKSKDQLIDITEALVAGGVPSIEVTMSTPKAIAGIELLADKLGEKAIIGVGTCIDAATARDAIAAGAQLVVSPGFDRESGG